MDTNKTQFCTTINCWNRGIKSNNYVRQNLFYHLPLFPFPSLPSPNPYCKHLIVKGCVGAWRATQLSHLGVYSFEVVWKFELIFLTVESWQKNSWCNKTIIQFESEEQGDMLYLGKRPLGKHRIHFDLSFWNFPLSLFDNALICLFVLCPKLATNYVPLWKLGRGWRYALKTSTIYKVDDRE